MAIDVAAQVRYWRDSATDDVQAAQALLTAGKARQAGFFVHLAIEKALKARVVQATGDVPPRTHDLLLLAARAGIAMPDQNRAYLGRMQMYCLEGRYPTESVPPPSPQTVRDDLNRALEMIQWLIKPLNSP